MALQELLIHELLALYAEECIDAVARLQLEHVLYSTALGILRALWYLEAALPIHPTLLSEEEYHVVGISRIYVFREVLFTSTGTTGTYAATALHAEVILQGALDVAQV